MATYKELLAQHTALEARINAARQKEMISALGQVQKLIAEFELTPADIFGGKTARASAGGKAGTKAQPAAAKYRNPATGATWTGRGRAPQWLAGQDRSQFAV